MNLFAVCGVLVCIAAADPSTVKIHLFRTYNAADSIVAVQGLVHRRGTIVLFGKGIIPCQSNGQFLSRNLAYVTGKARSRQVIVACLIAAQS